MTFASGFTTLLSGPFLFQHSFGMSLEYREIKKFINLHGDDIGLSRTQVRHVVSSSQSDLIRTIKEKLDDPGLPVKKDRRRASA